jgi:hypothetical protein
MSMPFCPPEVGLNVVLRPEVNVVGAGAQAEVVVASLRLAQRGHGHSHGLLGRFERAPRS